MAEHEKSANKAARINQLVNSMTQELNYYWSLGEEFDNGSKSCMIYKVQQHIRDVDRFSYQPLLVSIGPYHNGSVASMDFERVKWRFLDYVLKLNRDKKLLDYLTALGELAKQARHCYSEDVNMNNEEFIEMLLLDGCLILVGLGGTNNMLGCSQHEVPSRCDPEELTAGIEGSGNLNYVQGDATSSESKTSHGKSQNDEIEASGSSQQTEDVGQWFIRFMNHDLLLLENQIPYFIVEKIYELVSGKDTTTASCSDEFAKYIEAALRCYPKAIQESDRPKHFHHLLHLCHFYFRPTQRPEEELHHQAGPQFLNRFLSFGRKYIKVGRGVEDIEGGLSPNQDTEYLHAGEQLNRWRRAAQYLEAGIKFKKRRYDKLDPHSVLDIKFGNGVMEIPCHIIDEYTGTLFRNLVAFEQTCPQFGDDVTAYIVFMSQLISMPEDVTLLSDREILVHHLDSDETVSDLFTMLSKDVVFDFNGTYYLKSLCQIMEAHYQSRLNRWIAWLWLNHFSNPWLCLAAFATVIVLICTIVQTIFGILAYTNPPST